MRLMMNTIVSFYTTNETSQGLNLQRTLNTWNRIEGWKDIMENKCKHHFQEAKFLRKFEAIFKILELTELNLFTFQTECYTNLSQNMCNFIT